MAEQSVTASREEPKQDTTSSFAGKKLVFCSTLAALIITGIGALVAMRIVSHDVCVINGIYEPLIVKIDEHEPITIALDSHERIRVATGDHVVEILSPESFRSKKQFSISGSRWRWQSGPIWILDPTETSIQSLERIVYESDGSVWGWADSSEVSSCENKLLTAYTNVDYLNEEPPDEIGFEEADPSSGVVVKDYLTCYVLSGIGPFFSLAMLDHTATKRPIDVEILLAESLLRSEPDSVQAFEYLLQLCLTPETKEMNDLVNATLNERPIKANMHRKFQDAFWSSQPESNALVQRYDGYLRADPSNSMLLYLRGRMEATVDSGNEYFAKAIESDPQNALALYLLARNYMSACEFDAAQKKFQQLVTLKPDDETYRSEYIRSLYATHDMPALRKIVNLKPDDFQEFYVTAHFLKLSGNEDQFAKMKKEFLSDETNWAYYVAFVNANWAYLNGDIETYQEQIVRGRFQEDNHRWGVRLQIGIETGDVSEILWLLEKLPPFETDQTLPLMAVVLNRAGKPEEARQIWNRFVDRMAKRRGAEKLMAKLAKEGEFRQVDIKEFRQLSIWSLYKRTYALGFREFTKDAGVEWDNEIRALNFERWYPYHFVKSVIEKN